MTYEEFAKIIISDNQKMTPIQILGKIQAASGYSIERSLKGYYEMKEIGLFQEILENEEEEILMRDVRVLALAKEFDLKIEI